jgi:PEP-CTERM motif
MRFVRTLCLATVVCFVGVPATNAAIIPYSFAVTITGSGVVSNPLAGETYTGTFLADTAIGLLTDFQANLLRGNFSSPNLGNVATFDAANNVTRLTFQSSVMAFDGIHSFGFTSGFNSIQISSLGLNPNNYFAYLNTTSFVQGGGTPVFTPLQVPVPEPASLTLFGLACAGFAAASRRRA